MEPYYSESGITLYCGDNLEVLPHVEPVDLIFTSPPYNMGNTTGGGLSQYSGTIGVMGKRGGRGKWGGCALSGGYESFHDDMPHDAYVAWQKAVLTACYARLTAAGAIFYNHKPRVFDGQLVTPLDYNPNLPLRQIIIWARAGGINFSPSFYLPTHEWICLFTKPDFRLKSKGASGAGDVWTIPQELNNPHPAPFPIGLPARAIETTGAKTILDPFCGSGTTLRAAKDAGIKAIGIELSERYCEQAANRLRQSVLAFA